MNYENEKRQFRVYFFVIVLVVVFASGVAVGKKNGNPAETIVKANGSEALSSADLDLLRKSWDIINKDYVGDIPDKQTMVEGATRGLVAALGDPYTVFLDKEESSDFQGEMEGSFEGIGAEIGMREETLVVIAPLDGMPAAKAGIKAGDKIMKIDEAGTSDMSVDEAVKKIRGPKGTQVKLTIVRGDNEEAEPMEFNLTRDKIDVKSVAWELKEEHVAYIRISAFLRDTTTELDKVAAEIVASKADRIVLDLRSNPGGYLDGSVEVAGYFLPRKSLVVTEDYGEANKSKNKEHRTGGNEALADYPLAVLTNEGTASAAEILAGALRDNRGVQLVGKKTFGKGSVQEVEKLPGGSSVKVTVAKWMTPKGVNINKEGLKPDAEVDLPQGANNAVPDDTQLKKAIEVLKL